MGRVVVYLDRGAEAVSFKQAFRALRRELDHHVVERISSDILIEQGLKGVDLLVMPGGLYSLFAERLNGRGCEIIRQFVKEGGSYLGLCAGAYFASRLIDFERGHRYAIYEEGELSLFSGIAEGSALGLGTFSIESKQGCQAAKIRWCGGGDVPEDQTLFYYGGCRFVGTEGVELLAQYENGDAAIIECQVGNGRAILCGIHPEYNTETLGTSDPHIAPILPELKRGEAARHELLHHLFSRLVSL